MTLSFQLASVFLSTAIATELALAQKIVELKNKIDREKAQFKRNMANLSMADVQSFKQMFCMSSRSSFTKNLRKIKVPERE